MTGCRCTVFDCNNSRINAQKAGRQISFHRFPKEPETRQIWVQRCNRGGKWNFNSCRVCSDHFTPEDYDNESDLQAELLGIPAKKKLKATAVPSLKVRKGTDTGSNKRREQSRCNKKLAKRSLSNNDEESRLPSTATFEIAMNSDPSLENDYEDLLLENNVIKKQCTHLKKDNDSLKLHINNLEKYVGDISSK